MHLTVPEGDVFLADENPAALADLFIVSKVELTVGRELAVKVENAAGTKCPRCWKHSTAANAQRRGAVPALRRGRAPSARPAVSEILCDKEKIRMTRSEWNAAARAQLGGGIFKDQWLMGVVFCLVVSAIVGAAGSILPGVGALVVTGPMLYAQKYAFLAQAREGRGIDLNDLFRGFRDDFGGTLLISLLSGLFIFLWSLLLFIPGIVKAYAYSMVYYVKADHPEYGWRECLDESQRLMTGHKWEKFVLDLSFIGWGIVGSLCLGVGTLWVMTYMAATEAQYYEYLTSGKTSPEF